MIRQKILIICAFCLIICAVAEAQDTVKQIEDKDSKKDAKVCTIQSLDGKNSAIHIMPDYFRHKLMISYLKDTITIEDYWGVPVDLKLLDKHFLEINYAVRGGSGLSLDNALLICTSGNRLHNALHIEKNVTWESGYSNGLYDVKFRVTPADSPPRSRLTAAITDYKHSKKEPNDSYDYSDNTVLSFDQRTYVFYSLKQTLFAKLSYMKNGRTHYKTIRGTFPMVILGKETYYYIDGKWCQMEDSDKLSEFEN